MISGEDEKPEYNSIKKDSKDEIVKQKILDENYRRAEISLGLRKKEKKATVYSKKHFFQFGVFLIIAAVICLVITEMIPWFYVKCEINDNGNTTILKTNYYKDFLTRDGDDRNQIRELFEPINGSYLLGLSVDDFFSASIFSYYSFLILILLGLIFTVFAVLYMFSKLSHETMIVIQSVTSTVSAVICIFLLIVFIRFGAAYVLFYYNIDSINQMVSNASVSLPVPIIMIIIFSFILKICFTMVKLGYRELERKMKNDSIKKKQVLHIEYEV